ncbi:MAG: acetoin utilization protein AcuC, partial [Actinomycetota bacterium]|nr:acetoin utilization protein AcuC [Actinomycetota bacterium]
MSAHVGVVWDDALSGYDLGPSHPLAPMRAQLAMRLSHEFGLFSHVNVELLDEVEPVERELLERVHTG